MMNSTLTIRNRYLLPLLGGTVLVVILAVLAPGLPLPVSVLRLLAGLLAALILPGFAFQLALFPEKDALDGPERLGLSFGLSIALIPQSLILLDFLPWGIRPLPIAFSIGAITLIGLVAAFIRLGRLPQEKRFRISFRIDYRNWSVTQSKQQKILYIVFASALVVALISATVILVSPRPDRAYTEFYLLNVEGMANDYPRITTMNKPVTLKVGIYNQEGADTEFSVEVQQAGRPLGLSDPTMVSASKRLEFPIIFSPSNPDQDAPIDFYLYRKGDSAPYRTLRLWMEVDQVKDGLLGSGN